MEAALVARFVGEAGIYGGGWALFLWAMLQMRLERKRYEDLVVHIVQYFTKINMIQGTQTDATHSPSQNRYHAVNDEGTRRDSHSANDA